MKNKKILPVLMTFSMMVSGSLTTFVNATGNSSTVVQQTIEDSKTTNTTVKKTKTSNKVSTTKAKSQTQSTNQATPLAAGKTIYINCADGLDSNNGAAVDSPVQTLDKALELAGEGGTIYVCGKRAIAITTEVTLGNNITFKKESESTSNSIFNVSGGGHLIVNNVTFDGGKGEANRKYIAGQAISVSDNGRVTVNDGAKFTKSYSAISASPLGIDYSNYKAGDAVVTINGGEFYDLGVDNDYKLISNSVISIDSHGDKAKAILTINNINIHDCVTEYGMLSIGGDGDATRVICNMYNGTITNNKMKVNADGDAPVARVNGQFNLYDGTIKKNIGASGGAFSVGEGGILNVNGGTITENSASKYGGAIFVAHSKGIVNINGGNIFKNSATKYGGAVYSYGTVNITGGNIYSNEAVDFAGAIANAGGKLNVTGGTISGNTSQYGGGIAAWGNSNTIVSDNALISANIAKGPASDPYSGGGGVYIQSGKLKVTGGTISKNSASYGGGIDVTGSKTIAEIEGNPLITENEVTDVTGQGGGIGIHDGSLTLNGGTISKNKGYAGSGLAIWNNASVIMDGDTKIIENEIIADSDTWAGGAVYLSANTNDGSKFVMNNGTISNNQGGVTWCGGLFIQSFKADAVAQITGGTISNNTNANKDDQSISLRGSNTNGNQKVGYLKLSGSPTITGQVLLRTDTVDEVKVDVVDAFSPTQPVKLSVMRSDWTDGRTLVTYAQGIAPNLDQFTPYNPTKTQGIKVKGQDLQCVSKLRVIFKDANGETTKDMYVLPNTKISEANLPTVTKDGYTFKYWKEGNSGKKWDFSQKEITEDLTVFVPEWANDSQVYTVKYVTNSSASIADLKVAEGNKATKPQLSNPNKGLVVEEWYTTATFEEGTKWNFDHPVKSDMTLYAKWVLKKPTGTLEAEGNVVTVHTGKTVKLIATANHESTGNITYSYQWYKDGKKLDSKTRAATGTNEIEVSETGSYTVKITASDGTYTSSALDVGPVEVKITDHTYTGDYKYDEDKHWKECDECQKHDHEDNHTYGKWAVVKEATKSEKGLAERECVLCGHKQTKEITFNEPIVPGNNTAPTIDAKNVEITVGQIFDAMKYATAKDAEDGDLTEKIKVVRNNVDTSKAGTYEVTYLVTDSQDLSRARTITVTVKEKAVIKESTTTTSKDNQKQEGTKGNEAVTSTNITKEESKKAKTGDDTNSMIFVELGGLSLIGGVLVYLKKKRDDMNNHHKI